MESAEFQKRFLAWAFGSEVPITAATVAHNLGITVQEAQDQLLSMELTGAIQPVVDPQGNSYWTLPHRQSGGGGPDLFLPPGEAVSYNPADLPPAPIYNNPADDPRQIHRMISEAVGSAEGKTDTQQQQRALRSLEAAALQGAGEPQSPARPVATDEVPPPKRPDTVTLRKSHLLLFAGAALLLAATAAVVAVLVLK